MLREMWGRQEETREAKAEMGGKRDVRKAGGDEGGQG